MIRLEWCTKKPAGEPLGERPACLALGAGSSQSLEMRLAGSIAAEDHDMKWNFFFGLMKYTYRKSIYMYQHMLASF